MNAPHRIWAMGETDSPLQVNIFSKHLQFLEYQAVGEKATEMGFSGVDLTVRPKGHVSPESVRIDLPKAIAAIKKGGSKCIMATTAVDKIGNETDVLVLRTMAEQGIRFYRCNWFDYQADKPMKDSLATFEEQIRKLGRLNKELGLVGCYQNHSGMRVGASVWELDTILGSVDPAYFGVQYDIRHAIVEGGLSWENGLRLLHPHIKTIALKDFKWAQVKGKWKAVNTPIGEGMVDFKKYFGLLKKYKVNVPVSLHCEYPLGGAEHGKSVITVDQHIVFDAMKNDLRKIQTLWEEA